MLVQDKGILRRKLSEYKQKIKTFRWKYIFLAGKSIRTARSVVMKLSEKREKDAKIKPRLSKSSPFEVKMLVEFIRRGISDKDNLS